MTVRGFDHYNLRAARADARRAARLLPRRRGAHGRRRGRRFAASAIGSTRASKAVLHLSLTDDGEERSGTAVNTFSHAAFNCTGRAEFERRLKSLGIPYRTAQVPLLNLAQLFFHDPAGNGVELQFDASEPAG